MPILRAVFRLALYLAPREYRVANRNDLLDAYDDAMREASKCGFGARLACSTRLVVDVAISSFAERFDAIRGELAFSIRVLSKAPAFSLVIILTLAVTIAANATAFSLVKGTLFRPLPFKNSDRLVFLFSTSRQAGQFCPHCPFSMPDFRDFRVQNQTLRSMAVYKDGAATITGLGTAFMPSTINVDAAFFPTLAIRPALGRFFHSTDTARHAPPVAIVSYELWMRRFAGDPLIVGRRITINDVPTTIIGVAPPGAPDARFLDRRQDLYLPTVSTDESEQRGNHEFRSIARLRDGANIAQARSDLDRIAANLARLNPGDDRGRGIFIEGMADRIVGNVRPILTVIAAACLMLLFVACANVANLMLARAAARRRQLLLRAAIGATPACLIAQLSAETLVLGATGGIIGVTLTAIALQAIGPLLPHAISRITELHFESTSVLVSIVVTSIVMFIAGLGPAVGLRRLNLAEALKAAGERSAAGTAGERARAGFVLLQIALALSLSLAGALVVQSYRNMVATPLGFDPHDVLESETNLSEKRFPDPRQLTTYVDRLRGAINAIPGVRTSAVSMSVPLDGNDATTTFELPGDSPATSSSPTANIDLLSPGYFATYHIALLQGRDFSESDDATAPLVVIVSESFVKRYLGAGNPIGRRLFPGFDTNDEQAKHARTVVGVVADVRSENVANAPGPTEYIAYAQTPLNSIALSVKSSLPSASIEQAVDTAWSSIDPEHPPGGWTAIDSFVGDDTANTRAIAALLGSLAIIATILAAVGVFSITSYLVTRKTRDIGIRMALGAAAPRVMATIVLGAASLAAIGVACGMILALFASRTLSAILYGIAPNDPKTFIGAGLALVALVTLAAFGPARRATRIDPLEALRYE